jgi:catechol 2,3-dioxygenase-like lactoylglutathione lyase family enzyme
MRRLHVHVAVHDLERSVRFYRALFGAELTVRKNDYAKWQLEDPRVNFAISQRGADGLLRSGIRMSAGGGAKRALP